MLAAPSLFQHVSAALPLIQPTSAVGLILAFAGLFATAASAHESAPAVPGVQSLDVCRNGAQLVLLTGEADTEKSPAMLKVRVSKDDGLTWSDPVRVDAGCPAPVGLHRGMDAQIAAHGDHFAAVWQQAGTDPWGGGPMATSISSDGGKTWKPGPNPADDQSTLGHNFVDIAADGKGVMHCVWLDTRNEKRGLRSAKSTDFGVTWAANQTVDAQTCECCWNGLAVSPEGGAWVIYRGHAPRDMTVAALTDKIPLPAVAGNFGWDFPGCPHVGAGLSLGSNGQTLHAAVWTGKPGKAGVYHVVSRDLGQTWLPPQRLGADGARNPDCASGPHKSTAVVWNEPSGPDNTLTKVMASTSTDGGAHWTAPQQLSKPTEDALFPKVLPTQTGFRVFWTTRGEKATTWASAPLTAASAP
jgi:hypothetical protein